jgi:pyrimidine 5'-nucleotidase
LILPDLALREVLLRYPQRKIIFTNADRKHAVRVVRQLQLENCFESVIDIYDLAPYCKPMPEAYQTALRLSGETHPERIIFIDDSPHNLAAARALGFFTVQVGLPKPGFHHPPASSHFQIARLIDLPDILDPLSMDE